MKVLQSAHHIDRQWLRGTLQPVPSEFLSIPLSQSLSSRVSPLWMAQYSTDSCHRGRVRRSLLSPINSSTDRTIPEIVLKKGPTILESESNFCLLGISFVRSYVYAVSVRYDLSVECLSTHDVVMPG